MMCHTIDAASRATGDRKATLGQLFTQHFPHRSPYHEGARLPTTASCMLLSTSTRPRTNSAPGKSGIERNNGGKRGSSAVRRWLSVCSSHSRLRSSSLSLNEKTFTACLGESPDALTASASTVARRSSLCALPASRHRITTRCL